MTRRGHWPTHPTVFLSITEILKHADHARDVLVHRRVRFVDLDDALQETMLGAWTSAKNGRFCPNPKRKRDDSVKAWLGAIAAHVASRLLDKAYRRHEQAEGLMFKFESEPWDEDARIDAADDLELLALISVPVRTPMLLRAEGQEYKFIARALGVPFGTAVSRVGYGRIRFRVLMRRRRRGNARTYYSAPSEGVKASRVARPESHVRQVRGHVGRSGSCRTPSDMPTGRRTSPKTPTNKPSRRARRASRPP